MFKRNCLSVQYDITLKALVETVLQTKSKYDEFGFTLVKKENKFVGLISRGDFISLIDKDKSKSMLVHDLMNKTPIVFTVNSPFENSWYQELYDFLINLKKIPTIIPVNNRKSEVISVIDTAAFLASRNRVTKIAVYGMGFVGLTLAVALANSGYKVTGIDRNQNLIEDLINKELHIHEDGLQLAVKSALDQGNLTFTSSEFSNCDIYIIAVGTPIDDGAVDTFALESVSCAIAKRLKVNQTIIVRSTVPAGTCQSLVLKTIEKYSGLKAGVDFKLAFAPERTIEGQAYNELFTLPQIVGGLTQECAYAAGEVFRKLTSKIIYLDTMEEAEFCKLLNNSYRDLTFAFSNAFALSIQDTNIDAAKVLHAAGLDYVRGKLPKPSPGVGGYCLTKDPQLLKASLTEYSMLGKFTELGRQTNEASILLPIQRFENFIRTNNIQEALNILVVGVAFKGNPETNDIRGSTSIIIGKKLSDMGHSVFYHDCVLNEDELEKKGFKSTNQEVEYFDAIFLLNDHVNNPNKFWTYFKKEKTKFICDAWSQINPASLPSSIQFATLTKNY